MKNKFLVIGIMILVLIPLRFTYLQSAEMPGMKPPLIVLSIFFILIAILNFVSEFKFISKLKFKSNFITDLFNDIFTSSFIKFLFIPGSEFFSDGMKEALDRPKASEVSKCAIILLFAIIFGSSFLAPPPLLTDYYLQKNWFIAENSQQWVGAYSVFACSYILYTVFLNILVRFAIRLGYQIDSTKKLEQLISYFKIPEKKIAEPDYWGRLSTQLEHIYGHKTWGGEKMYNFLQEIQKRKEEMGTSQWFLLQFASDALDHHVTDDKIGLSFTYKNSSGYSDFLARSMGYCNKCMIWIVDEKDFHDEIFPVLIREVVLSLAQSFPRQEQEKIKDNQIIEKLMKLSKKYKPTRKILPYCQEFCDIYCDFSKVNEKCYEKTDDEKECKFSSWKDLINNYCNKWVNDVLKDKLEDIPNIDIDKIHEFYQDRKTDRFPYPHLQKFYDHPVPKARIIVISNIGISEWEDNSDDVKCKLVFSNLFEKHQILTDNQNFVTPDIDMIDKSARYYISSSEHTKEDALDLSFLEYKEEDADEIQTKKKKARLHIFLTAWELFEKLSNSNTKQKIVGFAPVRSMITTEGNIADMLIKSNPRQSIAAQHLDLGIYDQRVMVHSIPAGNDGRKVQWCILPDSVTVFSEIDPSSEDNLKDNKMVLNLGEFKKFLRKIAIT